MLIICDFALKYSLNAQQVIKYKMKDLQFLLVGPIWLLHFVLKKIGIKY